MASLIYNRSFVHLSKRIKFEHCSIRHALSGKPLHYSTSSAPPVPVIKPDEPLTESLRLTNHLDEVIANSDRIKPIVELSNETEVEESERRLPRSVQTVYLRPLRRQAKYGIPCCDLQLRSYTVRNLEFFADFALRAAYYLKLPASGPVPLPRIVERWTVPRSNFIFKKSQENFERKTLRRLIQIQDGHPETVEMWLAFLRKHAYYGVGMKANMWAYEKLGVGKSMDSHVENAEGVLQSQWARFGGRNNASASEKIKHLMNESNYG